MYRIDGVSKKTRSLFEAHSLSGEAYDDSTMFWIGLIVPSLFASVEAIVSFVSWYTRVRSLKHKYRSLSVS